MSVYLDTRGNSVLSVGICDRCNRKMAYVDLYPDPNFPGMRVCKEDLDVFDPWRLPARQTENIALRWPRPDVSVALQSVVNATASAALMTAACSGVAPGEFLATRSCTKSTMSADKSLA